MIEPNPLEYLEPTYRPMLRKEAFSVSLGQESVIWAEDARSPVYLDPAATLLVSIFDGSATSSELVEDLAEALEVEPEVAQANMRRVLLTLAGGRVLAYAARPVDHELSLHASLPEPNW